MYINEVLAKIAFEGKFDDFDSRPNFCKLTYPTKDRQFKKIESRGQKREFLLKMEFCKSLK